MSVEDLADPELVRRALEDYECVVADAERDADLEALVRAVPDPASVLWAGSAGLALALGSVYPGPCAGTAGVQRAPVRPVLVVVGSLSGVAREQVRRLVEAYGEVDVPVDGKGPTLCERLQTLPGGLLPMERAPSFTRPKREALPANRSSGRLPRWPRFSRKRGYSRGWS